MEKTIDPCRTAIKDAGIKPDELNDIILVGGMTRMPLVQKQVKDLFGKEPRKDINPDEAVAIGAAIQAAVLKGDVTDLQLLDVTPLSLGVETEGKVMTALIEKNTTIPVSESKIFSTASDNQSAVTIHVLQGERSMATDNKSLGMFNLGGIAPAPRGMPQIEVKFDIDANGILHVTAIDKKTGKDAKITITADSGLTEDEIKRMISEAEEHAEEDKKFKDLTQIRNAADGLCSSIRQQLKKHGDDLTEEQRKAIDDGIKELEEKIQKGEHDDISKASEALASVCEPLSDLALKAQQQEETADEEDKPDDANVEIVDEKDDKSKPN